MHSQGISTVSGSDAGGAGREIAIGTARGPTAAEAFSCGTRGPGGRGAAGAGLKGRCDTAFSTAPEEAAVRCLWAECDRGGLRAGVSGQDAANHAHRHGSAAGRDDPAPLDADLPGLARTRSRASPNSRTVENRVRSGPLLRARWRIGSAGQVQPRVSSWRGEGTGAQAAVPGQELLLAKGGKRVHRPSARRPEAGTAVRERRNRSSPGSDRAGSASRLSPRGQRFRSHTPWGCPHRPTRYSPATKSRWRMPC